MQTALHPSPQTPLSILIADDQDDVRASLRLELKTEGFAIETVENADDALTAVASRPFDVMLMDLNLSRGATSGDDGLDLIPRIKAVDAELPVVAMTAWATVPLTIEAMRRGARDFILKPWEHDALINAVRSHGSGTRSRRVTGEIARPAIDARDLDKAHRIQARLLPPTPPSLRTLACAARCEEAGAVGGDGYDFIHLGNGRVAIVTADISGKGVSGALLWASLQATLRSETPAFEHDLPALVRRVNERFLAATGGESYATLFVGVYDDATRELRYANCGHATPVLLRADGSAENIAPTSTVVGLVEDVIASADAARLDIGVDDTFVLASDGVLEAGPLTGHGVLEFGTDGLRTAIRSHGRGPLEALPDAILDAVREFESGDARDDRTVVALRGR